MNKNYLLFDIGATNTRLATSRIGKKLDATVIVKTPKKFADGMKLISVTAKKLCGGRITGAAGGIAGSLDLKKEKVYVAPNLPAWNGMPLKKELQKIVAGKIMLENDNTMVGLGEARLGAGRGYSIVVYYTFSTGINGIKIVDGKFVPSAMGVEAGHQLIGKETLFDAVSGTRLAKKYGKPAHDIRSRKVWRDVAKKISLGLYNSTLHWSPEVIVLGGGIMNSVSLSDVERNLKNSLKILPAIPKIKKAALGDLGGLYGALEVLKDLSRTKS